VGQPEPERVALERLVAFGETGADCLFAPGVREPDEIAAMVKAVRPAGECLSLPPNRICRSPPGELGVRGFPVGSALARVAWGAFIRAAQDIKNTGLVRWTGLAPPRSANSTM